MFDGGSSSPPSPGPPSLSFAVLRQWKPNDNPNGYGAELLLNKDATAQELIEDMKKLGKDHDPVFISVYSSWKAYDDAENDIYGEEFARGFILVYVKNYTGQGAFRGFNEIRWMQEKGKFSSRSGTVTKL